jgi:hypothetical protein
VLLGEELMREPAENATLAVGVAAPAEEVGLAEHQEPLGAVALILVGARALLIALMGRVRDRIGQEGVVYAPCSR